MNRYLLLVAAFSFLLISCASNKASEEYESPRAESVKAQKLASQNRDRFAEGIASGYVYVDGLGVGYFLGAPCQDLLSKRLKSKDSENLCAADGLGFLYMSNLEKPFTEATLSFKAGTGLNTAQFRFSGPASFKDLETRLIKTLGRPKYSVDDPVSSGRQSERYWHIGDVLVSMMYWSGNGKGWLQASNRSR